MCDLASKKGEMLQGVEATPLRMVCPSSMGEVVMLTSVQEFYYSHT